MRKILVKSLSGDLWEVEQGVLGTVKELRTRLMQQVPSLKQVIFWFEGKKLRDEDQVEPLCISEQGFLTAFVKWSLRHKSDRLSKEPPKRMRKTNIAEDCSLAAEIDGTGPSIGVSQQLVQHDADCYSGRKPGCDSQWAHSRPTLEEELLSELQAEQQGILSSSTRVGDDTSATPPQRSPRSACPGDPSSGAAAQQKHGKARQRAGYRGGRSMVRDGSRDDAHPRIPLPTELESLQRKFQALNGVYSFMIMQHLQATWRNCNRAAQELLETYGHGDRLHADDLQAMALLAPDMIVIRDRTTAVAASSGHGGLANESGGNEGDRDFVIELMEPGRTGSGNALPENQACRRGGSELGMDAAGSCARGLQGSGGTTGRSPSSAIGMQKHSNTACKRRLAGFRRRLILAAAAALSARGLPHQIDAWLGGVERDKDLHGDSHLLQSDDYRAITVQEACNAIASREGGADASVAAAHARLASGDPSAPRPPRASKKGCCCDARQLNVDEFLPHLRSLPWYEDQIAHVEAVPERPAQYMRLSTPISGATERALLSRSLHRLYTHQVRAVEAALEGKNVAVAASTASGKSLCYNIPIMEAIAQDAKACAIYIFPTKALAQDQMGAVRRLLEAGFANMAPVVEVYDGDTAPGERDRIRDTAQLVITNPDMLHCSILPVHQQFARILANLRYVVIDEGHSYTGVFGAHTGLVIRRLRRVCEVHYRSSPQFIVTSATMANPKEHTQELIGATDVHVVDDDGSPHGKKSFVLWNPPLKYDKRLLEKRRKQPSRRLRQQLSRESRRTVNQVRGAGVQLGRDENDEAEWFAACKIARRGNFQPIAPTGESNILNSNEGLAQQCALPGVAAFADVAGGGGARPAASGGASRSWSESKPRRFIYKGAGGLSPQDRAEAQRQIQEKLSHSWKNVSEAEVLHGAAGISASSRRTSPMVEVAMLVAECVQHNVRTLAFCKSRKLCELVTCYIRDILRESKPELADMVAVYRSGYSAADRRKIEKDLLDGRLRAVCATNAMELGLDIGDLDATVHLGFPGTIASLWQQAGRAGRRGQHSLAVYVAFDGPLDQYFFARPKDLFKRAIEQTTVDAQNRQLLQPHLVCAAVELPLQLHSDDAYFGSGLRDCAQSLVPAGLLAAHPQAKTDDVLHYVGTKANYASGISLRAIDPNRIKIVSEEGGGAVLEEVEEFKAFWQIYEGAIYYHQGRSYLCKSLDLQRRVAIVRRADVKYYTTTADFADVHVVGGALAYPMSTGGRDCPFTSAVVANAVVTARWIAYHRIWQSSGRVFDTVPLHLPDMAYETQAVYIRVPAAARKACKEAGLPFRDGLHAACHAILNVVPLYLTCSPVDLGTECDNPYDTRYRPERLLLYDKQPGGIGLAQQLHPLMGVLIPRALELVEQCGCTSDHGCPSCIQHTDCMEYNSVLNKESARVVLSLVLKHEVKVECKAEEL